MGGRPKISPEDRFWEKVGKSPGCWEWQAQLNNKGYGLFRPCGTDPKVAAHRFSYRLAHRAIPDGKWVLHRCDNRKCVNPAHLFVGTHSDNMRDMFTKGRSGRSKIGPDEVREIRRRKQVGEKYQDIANYLGVSLDAVKKIGAGRTWSYLDLTGGSNR
jgi:hypothetical protein